MEQVSLPYLPVRVLQALPFNGIRDQAIKQQAVVILPAYPQRSLLLPDGVAGTVFTIAVTFW